MRSLFRKPVPPEIHVFLVWHNALDRADDILTDVERRFRVLDVVDVEWSRERFAQNLTRFYRDELPPGSEKERHCGTGPFRVIVVKDDDPRYARRGTSRGRTAVNAHVFDARARYRAWTGGGHRIHGSLTPREADHDLYLLLGRRAAFYEAGTGEPPDREARQRTEDLLGAGAWESRAQLLTALEVTVSYVVLPELASTRVDRANPLRLLVESTWWAAVSANARRVEDAPARYAANVGGAELFLELSSLADGGDRVAWFTEVLRRRVSSGDGAFVPAPIDYFYLMLAGAIDEGEAFPGWAHEELDELAIEHSLPRGDFGDLAFVRDAVDEFLASSYAKASPPADRRSRALGVLGRKTRTD